MTAPARQPMAPFTLDREWRGSGMAFADAYLIDGNQPKIGAPADRFLSFYDGAQRPPSPGASRTSGIVPADVRPHRPAPATSLPETKE